MVTLETTFLDIFSAPDECNPPFPWLTQEKDILKKVHDFRTMPDPEHHHWDLRVELTEVMKYIQKNAPAGTNLQEYTGQFVTTARTLSKIATAVTRTDSNLHIFAAKQKDVIFIITAPGREMNETESHSNRNKLCELIRENDHSNIDNKTKKCMSVLKAKMSNGAQAIDVFYGAEFDFMDKEYNFVDVQNIDVCRRKWLIEKSGDWFMRSELGKISRSFYLTNGSSPGLKKIRTITKEKIAYKARNLWSKERRCEGLFNFLRFLQDEMTMNNMTISYEFNTKKLKKMYGFAFVDEEFSDNYL